MTTPNKFKRAMAQSHQIKRRKTVNGQKRQIKKWCEMVMEAFRGTDQKTTTE